MPTLNKYTKNYHISFNKLNNIFSKPKKKYKIIDKKRNICQIKFNISKKNSKKKFIQSILYKYAI